jgi:hypothetical protein
VFLPVATGVFGQSNKKSKLPSHDTALEAMYKCVARAYVTTETTTATMMMMMMMMLMMIVMMMWWRSCSLL